MSDPYLVCPACEVAFDSAETRRSAVGLRCPNCGQVVEAWGDRLPRGIPVQVWLAAVLLIAPGPLAIIAAYFVGPAPEVLWAAAAGAVILSVMAVGLLARSAWARTTVQLLLVTGAIVAVAGGYYLVFFQWNNLPVFPWVIIYAVVNLLPAIVWCGTIFALLQVRTTRRWFARPYRFADDEK